MNNNSTTASGIPSAFQAFFNTLDGRRNLIKADSVQASEISASSIDLKTVGGEEINITGTLKNGQPALKAKRKAKA